MEAFAIGTVGLILGFALGAVNLYYTLEMVHRQVTGFELVYQFRWRINLGLIPVMLLAALLVSIWARRSSWSTRISLRLWSTNNGYMYRLPLSQVGGDLWTGSKGHVFRRPDGSLWPNSYLGQNIREYGRFSRCLRTSCYIRYDIRSGLD
jgi:hypothetical protein